MTFKHQVCTLRTVMCSLRLLALPVKRKTREVWPVSVTSHDRPKPLYSQYETLKQENRREFKTKMDLLFFGAFSILAALLFNAANPRIMAMKWAQSPRAMTYAGKTGVTAISFFVVLLAAGFVMSLVKQGASTPPTA